MSTIRSEVPVSAPSAAVWDAVRDFGAAHRRLFPGVLTDVTLDGDRARVVTFANGLIVRELLVSVDDDARRLVYSSVGGRASHHNAALEVRDDAAGNSVVVWTTDLLPDELAQIVAGLVEAGSAAMKTTLDRAGDT